MIEYSRTCKLHLRIYIDGYRTNYENSIKWMVAWSLGTTDPSTDQKLNIQPKKAPSLPIRFRDLFVKTLLCSWVDAMCQFKSAASATERGCRG